MPPFFPHVAAVDKGLPNAGHNCPIFRQHRMIAQYLGASIPGAAVRLRPGPPRRLTYGYFSLIFQYVVAICARFAMQVAWNL